MDGQVLVIPQPNKLYLGHIIVNLLGYFLLRNGQTVSQYGLIKGKCTGKNKATCNLSNLPATQLDEALDIIVF